MDLSRFDLAAYCKRTAYEGPLEPTLEVLQGLNLAHAYRISYENLEIHLGRPMVIAEGPLEQLILHQPRGGYCFQMNLLFARALEAVGFPVALLAGRGWLTSGGAVPPPAHLVLEVKAEGASWHR